MQPPCKAARLRNEGSAALQYTKNEGIVANDSRITLFAGHYGSGKTNIAVSYALDLRKRHARVAIADLDIVNPYFRTKDGEKALEAAGIQIISSVYANSNLDAPAMPPDAVRLFDDKEIFGVIDLGGDDRGAYAMGRYAERLTAEADAQILFVLNRFRPLTTTPASALEVLREIEQAAGFKFTGLVNNSNLGAETTRETVLSSLAYADAVADLSGLPVVCTTVKADLCDELRNDVANLFPVHIMQKESWRM